MTNAFIFRPVRLEDKPRVLEFTAHTWGDDEDDYIQFVFDDWLSDPRGEFTAVESKGQVVAIAKLTALDHSEWWFEGLRVDPGARGQGLGIALNRYQVDLARKLGGKTIRYMTASDNIGSQVIGTKAGFQHVSTYIIYSAPALDQEFAGVRLSPADISAITPWLNSALVRQAHGLYRAGWKVRALTKAAVREMFDSHEVYGLKDQTGRLTAWCVLRPDDDEAASDRLRIDHIDGDLNSIGQLARSIQALAYQRHLEKVNAGLLDYEPLLRTMLQAGYQPHEQFFGLWVMELQL